jgi:hypothetical protein
MSDKSKLQITPTLRTELEEKFGKGVSITVIDADGTRHPLELDRADAPRGLNEVPEVNADDVKLIAIGEKSSCCTTCLPSTCATRHTTGSVRCCTNCNGTTTAAR